MNFFLIDRPNVVFPPNWDGVFWGESEVDVLWGYVEQSQSVPRSFHHDSLVLESFCFLSLSGGFDFDHDVIVDSDVPAFFLRVGRSVDFDFVSVLPEACCHEILSRFASLVYFEFGNDFVRAVNPRINPLFDGFFHDAD